MPSLRSFINSSQYSSESTTNKLLAGMDLGSAYAGITFNGASGSAGNDPGGLFGWLIYSRRYKYTPQKGNTYDPYIVYTNPQDLVGDLNKLGGITYALVATSGGGGTYSLFLNTGTVNNVVRLAPTSIGTDFLHAINYLAYGGTLVVAPDTTGFDLYQNITTNKLDVIIGQQGTTGLAQWLINQKYTVGIFPSGADSAGVTGNGYTMADYATLFGDSALVSGTTVANRIFNVYGIKTVTNLDTTTLVSGSKLTYSIPAVGDVGGFFARSKNRNLLYLSVAGLNLSTILNGTISNSIEWSNSIKTALRTNRVNFFVNPTALPQFLGADLTGATANSTIVQEDRIGVSKLKSAINNDLTTIGLKYLFQPNDATTRSHVTSEMKTAISKYSQFIFTQNTQIICDSTNNTDQSSVLVMTVVVQPILSLDSFEVTVTVTQ
jgi:hypothetical protein